MTDLPTRLRGAVPVVQRGVPWSLTPQRLAGLFAFLPAFALLAVRVGINAPVGPALPYGDVYEPVATAAVVGPGLGAIVLSITTDDDVVRVAMAFAGVFGLLTVLAPAAALPAAVALVGACGLLVVAHATRPFSADEVAESLVGTVFLLGVALSMAANVGLQPAMLRPLGSRVALLAVAGSPVFVEWNRRSVVVGAIGAAAFAGFAIAAPFVTGAASLIAGGIVGVSLPVLVLAVLGGLTLVATGVDLRAPELALAGAIILAAGVPASIPRGLTLVVGLALLLTHRNAQ